MSKHKATNERKTNNRSAGAGSRALIRKLADKLLYTMFLSVAAQVAAAQLRIESGTVMHLERNAVIAATGDVWVRGNLAGAGVLRLNGTRTQAISTDQKPLFNLSIDNPANVRLASDVAIEGMLRFIEGKLIVDNHTLALGSAAAITGAGPGSFLETIGDGQVKKIMSAAPGVYTFPIGAGNDFTPATIRSTGHSKPGAFLAARVNTAAHPDKPPGTRDFLHHYWSFWTTDAGSGQYIATVSYQPASVTGEESALHVFSRANGNWTTEGLVNTRPHTITAPLRADRIDLYAMSADAPASGLKPAAAALYPNPTRSRSTLSFYLGREETVRVVLSDATGKILQHREFRASQGYHRHHLDLHTFPAGVYQVELTSASFRKSYRLTRL